MRDLVFPTHTRFFLCPNALEFEPIIPVLANMKPEFVHIYANSGAMFPEFRHNNHLDTYRKKRRENFGHKKAPGEGGNC